MVMLNCQASTDPLFARIASWSANPDEHAPRAGSRVDLRTYGIGAQILRDLQVGQMRLLSRPLKMPSIMPGFGLDITGYDYEPSNSNT